MDAIEQANPPLDVFRDQIADSLSRTAIEIGSILIEAKYAHPRTFVQWVEDELPFSYQKATRLMAISRAFRSLPDEKKALLPAPWTTLFTLSRIPEDQFSEAIEAGEVRPEMTNPAALAMLKREPAPPPRKKKGDRPGPPRGAVSRPKARMPTSLLLRELMRYHPSEVPPTQRARLIEWAREGEQDGFVVVEEGELPGSGPAPVLPEAAVGRSQGA